MGVEGLGLIAGISAQPFPNRTPLQAASEEGDSKPQHSQRKGRETRGAEMKGRENEWGYRGPLRSICCAGMVLVRGSLTQIQLSNSLARVSPYVRRGMQSLSDGFKLFLWTSLTPARNKSRIQMSKYNTTSLELHNVVSAQAKTNQNQKPPQTQILTDTWQNS